MLALVLVFAAVWFGVLDMRKLVRPDEGRYAEIPREMVATGDWLTPRLNAIKYFEKPPLQYWATATAYTVFGQHHWTARLWPALSGMLCLLLVFFAGRQLFGEKIAFYAALILASSPGFIMVGQINTLDMGLTLFMSATLLCLLLGLGDTQRDSQRTNSPWILAAWASAALAMLSKGLVAIVLPGGVLVAYIILQRDWRLLGRLRWGWGVSIFAVIAVPWFVLVQQANPEFFDFFFIREHFARFTSKVHRRSGGWWYFLPVLAFGMLPWLLYLLRALISAWRDTQDRATFQPRRFLLLWVVLIFLFFSLSGSKLPSYIMPIFPALALLLAHALAPAQARLLLWNAALLALGAGAIVAYSPYASRWANEFVPAELFALYTPWIFAAGAAGLACFLFAAWAGFRGQRALAITAIACGAFATTLIAALGHNSLSPSYSAYGLAQQIKAHISNDIPFYSVRNYDQTLDFYIKRPLTLVEYADEMAYGLEQEPDLWLPDLASFVAAWNRNPKALAIMEPATYAKLESDGLPMQIIGKDLRRMVVKKPDAAGNK